MASGDTTTQALVDSLPTVISDARIVREQKGGMSQLVDRKTLGEGIGTDWNEISLAALTAQSITETTDLDNPQQLDDTKFTITPTIVGIETFITDRTFQRISAQVVAEMGPLAQNAIERRKDTDGLAVFAGAGTTLAGAGTTLTSGHIAAAQARVSSNTNEPSQPPWRAVLHGFQIKDIYDELTAGVGTAAIPSGPTADVFSRGFTLAIAMAEVYPNGNISIDSNTDARGGVFAQEGIVLVQGRAPRAEVLRRPNRGGGGNSVFHYDEFAYGERSSGNWLVGILSDATAPTS